MNVLSEIEHLIIYKTYAAREEYDEEGSGLFLAEKLSCLYCDNVTSLKTWIEKTVREKDMLLFLGAGDIYYLAEYLSKSLK
jgi:UDP-N-acetylmuramate-alanine ligase